MLSKTQLMKIVEEWVTGQPTPWNHRSLPDLVDAANQFRALASELDADRYRRTGASYAATNFPVAKPGSAGGK